MADQRFLHLLETFPQDRPGCAPWPLINALSDEELDAYIGITTELRQTYDMNAPEGAVGGGVIGGWLAQARRMRPAMLRIPAGW